jgi:hypothetical protein
VCVSSLLDALDTVHELGKDSNCVHWLYAVDTGTAISIESSIVFITGYGEAMAQKHDSRVGVALERALRQGKPGR